MNKTKNQVYNIKASKACQDNLGACSNQVIDQELKNIKTILSNHTTINKLIKLNIVKFEIIGDQLILKSKSNATLKSNNKITVMQLLSNIVKSRYFGQCMNNWDKYDNANKSDYKYYIAISPTWFGDNDGWNKTHNMSEKRALYKR